MGSLEMEESTDSSGMWLEARAASTRSCGNVVDEGRQVAAATSRRSVRVRVWMEKVWVRRRGWRGEAALGPPALRKGGSVETLPGVDARQRW
jgi:hypothetical protein